MDLSDKGNEIIFFMDKSRRVALIPDEVHAELEIPSERRRVRIFSSRTIIGRGDVDLKLKDTKISEEHSAIGYFDGIFFILDLKSKNGTYVNGKRVYEKVLRDGDEVSVGDTVFSFSVSGRLHEEATERWPDGKATIVKILEMIGGESSVKKFDDPTRIKIEGEGKITDKAPLTQIFFEILSGDRKGSKFNFLQKEIIVGRGRGDLSLKDPDVSKRHAEITVYGIDQIFIRDLGSTNGTYVGTKKVDRKKLKSGDVITLGSTKIEVTFGQIIEHAYKNRHEGDAKPAEKFSGKQMFTFEIIKGQDRGKKIELGVGGHIVGRGSRGIDLADTDVSRAHAKIKIDFNGRIYINDLSSKNGTFVNGKRITRAELQSGDTLEVGKTMIKID